MYDVCLACGHRIYTVNAGMSRAIVTLAQRWTHGSRRRDKNHLPIPTHHKYEIIR